MKLSKGQNEVIHLMKNGYELGKTRFLTISAWLQEGGIGRGGKSVNVNINTLNSLHSKKLIVCVNRRSGTDAIFELTELGKTIKTD